MTSALERTLICCDEVVAELLSGFGDFLASEETSSRSQEDDRVHEAAQSKKCSDG